MREVEAFEFQVSANSSRSLAASTSEMQVFLSQFPLSSLSFRMSLCKSTECEWLKNWPYEVVARVADVGGNCGCVVQLIGIGGVESSAGDDDSGVTTDRRWTALRCSCVPKTQMINS